MPPLTGVFSLNIITVSFVVDIKSTDTALVPTPLSSLNPRDLVVYKFGTFILSLLRTHCSHPPVNLLVAEKIPVQADLKNNAFRGSFL